MIDEETFRKSLEALRAELYTYIEVFSAQTANMILESNGIDYTPNWDMFPTDHEKKAIEYVMDIAGGEEKPLREILVKSERKGEEKNEE